MDKGGPFTNGVRRPCVPYLNPNLPSFLTSYYIPLISYSFSFFFFFFSLSLIIFLSTSERGNMSLKVFWLVLMLVLLVLCSRIDIGEARKGRHWRLRRGASSSSLAKNKAKGKVGNGGGHHHHKGGAINRPSPDHRPVKPRPTPNPNPSPSPKQGKGGYPPSQRSVMFNVLDFGAKGDGVSDDTKVHAYT